MFCYTCERFIKKGHGKNIYWYAGEYRYYCILCLRWNIVDKNIAERRKSYSFWVIVPTLILSIFIYYLTIRQQKLEKSFSWLALFLALLPIIGALFIWWLKIKPKLNELDKKDWKPLLEKKVELTKMENYVYSLKKDKEFCHCEKCLVSESERIKSKR